MKNLKRALSLVLSTAMLAGMMVVGTGAAFADVKAEHNEEAIAVVSAAGIMGANKEFNPDSNITRNEMAVVMVNLLDLDTKDYAGAANFTDVPAWAADYVDACYANGIVSGVSATQYNGGANVTTAEAALMVLKALGYFEEAKLQDWLLDTIKTASKIDLLDGIDAKATAALTRNEVAQLVLNALEATMVEETSSGTNASITGEGFAIEMGASVTREDRTTSKYDYNNSGEKTLQLIEDLFGNDFEKKAAQKTDLGLPAIEWYNNDEKESVIVVADEADEIVIADKATTAKDLYIDEIDEDFEDEINDLAVKAGDVVYYYENGDNFDAYVVTYTLVKVTDIDDDMKKGEIEDGYSFQVELDEKYKVYDTDFVGFDYEEDDYILVVMGKDSDKNDVVYASELAETLEGKITSTKGKDADTKYYIDGEGYKNLSDEKLAVKDEITAILNKAGQIIKVTEKNAATKSDDFAYIYNTAPVATTDNYDDDGNKVDEDEIYAYVVLADGTKAKYVVEEDSRAEAKKGTVVAYSINKDDEIEIESSDLTWDEVAGSLKDESGKKSVATKDGKVYANSKTEFIFASWDDDDKMVVTTATGLKNVDIANQSMIVVYDAEDLEALYVFVEAEDEGIESDAKYAVMIDVDYSYTEDEDDNTFYTYTVYADGEETEMVFEDEQELAEGEVFAYTIDGDYAVVSKADYELVDGVVTYEGEDYIEITVAEAADDYTYENAEIHTVIEVRDADNKYDYTDAKDTGKLEKDAVIKFYANKDNEIEIVFIMEIDD